MINLTPFTRAVNKVSKSALQSSSEEMVGALGALVTKRLRRRSKPKPDAFERKCFETAAERIKTTRKRRVRRGKLQRYSATAKVDISRIGTFRHYLISTVRKHDNTWDAEAEHANCDNPKWAKNKLDFGWVAAEGFIEFVS